MNFNQFLVIMKITLAIVLLFGVFVVIMSDKSPPSSEENSGEYVDQVDVIRESMVIIVSKFSLILINHNC